LDETGLKAVLPVDQSGRVYVVGSVPLLHPEAQIVDEMLEGSRNQQLCRTSRSTPSTARPAR
jgi:integrase/recombinase XerD